MQTLRFLVGAVIGALFLMAVALMFVLGISAPPLLSVALLLMLGAGRHFLIESVGYRVKAVDANQSEDAARQEGMKQFQSSLMRRLAVAESVAVIGILLAFIAKTVIIYDVGASISILLLMIARLAVGAVGRPRRHRASSGTAHEPGSARCSASVAPQDGPVTDLG